jgi:hypothetical protein
MSTSKVAEYLRGYRITQLLYAASELGLFDVIAEGAVTLEETAARVKVPPMQIHRLVRVLVGLELVARDAENRFSLTPEGLSLASSHPYSMATAAKTFGAPYWWNAWGKLLDGLREDRVPFELANGVEFFQYLKQAPTFAAMFDQNMRLGTAAVADAVARALPMDTAWSGHLVDVGGGSGTLARALAERFPAASVTAFDQPEVVERASTDGRNYAVAAGDMFAAAPAADGYVLKDILHDWNDETCVSLLRSLARSSSAAHVYVVERLLDHPQSTVQAGLVDVTMLVLTGGRERTEAEYTALGREAGYTLRSTTHAAPDTFVMCFAPVT